MLVLGYPTPIEAMVVWKSYDIIGLDYQLPWIKIN